MNRISPKRKASANLMFTQSENDLQRAVAELLDYSGLTWCHPPNGGNRSAKTGALMKAMGAKAGVPDVLIFTPFPDPGGDDVDRHLSEIRGEYSPGLAIELKVGKNKPTPTQVKWMDRLRACGWRCEVCYTLDEVRAVLNSCYPAKFS